MQIDRHWLPNKFLDYFNKMSKTKKQQSSNYNNLMLQKSPTGVSGLDEITDGGIPMGRPTLIAGKAGCGKTLLSLQFIVKGAIEYGEPGVFMAFEELAEELTINTASLGF